MYVGVILNSFYIDSQVSSIPHVRGGDPNILCFDSLYG